MGKFIKYHCLTLVFFCLQECQSQTSHKVTRGSCITCKDLFQNQREEKEFCEEKNAICNDDNCKECKCQNQYSFISYKHGCKDYDDSMAILKSKLYNSPSNITLL